MKLALLGDISFDGSFDIVKNPKVKENLSEVASYLKNFDLVCCNLESPFTIDFHKGPAKSAYLGCHPENVSLLKYLNIGICNLANNHMMDYGTEGCKLTEEILQSAGILYFGMNDNGYVINIQDCSLEFNGYCCYSSNPGLYRKSPWGGVNVLNINTLRKFIQGAAQRSNIPVISIHAGIEHVNYPDISNIMWSRKFAEIVPYIYYGHHPHVLQGLEMYKDSLIAHSLGNFIFSDVLDDNGQIKVKMTENNRMSAILEIEIMFNKILNYRLCPIRIGEGKIDLLDYDSFSSEVYDFSEALSNPLQYLAKRHNLINNRIKERRRLRDFKWIVQHLSFRYAKLLLDMKRNKYSYKTNVLKQLDNNHLIQGK